MFDVCLSFSMHVGAPFITKDSVLQVEDTQTLCGGPTICPSVHACCPFQCYLTTLFLLVTMVQVLLETGTLVTFTVARHSGDVEGIVIDRTLMTQLDGTIDKGRH